MMSSDTQALSVFLLNCASMTHLSLCSYKMTFQPYSLGQKEEQGRQHVASWFCPSVTSIEVSLARTLLLHRKAG